MLQWQIMGSSRIAHVVESDQKKTRHSGRRALCGRYTGTGAASEPFFAISVGTEGDAIESYFARKCDDCSERLSPVGGGV